MDSTTYQRNYSRSPKRRATMYAWTRSEQGSISCRNSRLKYRYGITLDEYNEMLKNQNGVCAICKLSEKDKNLAVDHDHITGQVRGLLCRDCNESIGKFKHSFEILRNAASYLEAYGASPTIGNTR